ERRWDVTFSTYFTKLPPGVDCRWRFVLEGSPEAAARTPGLVTIDLCRPLGHAAETGLVAAARSGKPSFQALPVAAAPVKPAGAMRPDGAELERLLAADRDEMAEAALRNRRPGELAADFAAMPVAPPASIPNLPPLGMPELAGAKREFNRKERS